MESFPFRELEAKSLPMVDESVYPAITKPIRSNLDLPFRKLYNIEILDSSGTTHPALDRLKFNGPFVVKGWVPIEETILRRGQTGRNLVYVLATRIVEWTHEFNPRNIMQPIFWVYSENVCWYQVQSVSPVYTPIMAPLSDVCAYLDAIIQVIFVDKRAGDQSDILPHAANKLHMSLDTVNEKVAQYRSQLIDLCSNDSELNQLQIYKDWVAKQRLEEDRVAARSSAPTGSSSPISEPIVKPNSSSSTSSKLREVVAIRPSLSRPTSSSESRTSPSSAPASQKTPEALEAPRASEVSRSLASPESSGSSAPADIEEVLKPVDSPSSSMLSDQLQGLHVSTSAKRRQHSDMEEDHGPSFEQRPSKRMSHAMPTNTSVPPELDPSEDVTMDMEPVPMHAQQMDGDASGADESDQEDEASPTQPFGQSGAPHPYSALFEQSNSAKGTTQKINREMASQMRELVMSRVHEEGVLSLKTYLCMPKAQQVHHSTPLPNSPLPNPNVPTISMDLYWLLESGKMSSDLNQGRRYQPRVRNGLNGKGAYSGPSGNNTKKYPKRLGKTDN
ncbi:hypothetical protein DFQ26_004726 [Actinomortierella ambigua]|nr:hypothetical protein DFQ26_004726 [Actinomortierella ambigua]